MKEKEREEKAKKRTQKEQEIIQRQLSSIQPQSIDVLPKGGGVTVGGASSGGVDGGEILAEGACTTIEERASDGDQTTDESEDDCPVCHIKGLSCQWIACDYCDVWYHIHCTEVNPNVLPDIFYCSRCV